MKKLIIITDGERLRGFRLSEHRRRDDLSFHCTELHAESSAPATAASLADLVRHIQRLVAQEDAAFWNLVAPASILNELVRTIPAAAAERLTCTLNANLIEANLVEVALRFPPTPCRAARPPRKPRARKRQVSSV